MRLLQGDYSKKTQYTGDPVDIAVSFQDQGTKYIHIVDLDAAKDGSSGNRKVIKKIISAVSIPVEVGGGVRNRERINILLDSGADRIILGTIIIKEQSFVQELVDEFGDRLAAGIDAKNGIVRISGWTEKGNIKSIDLGKRVKQMGFPLIIYTDIVADGMMKGPNIIEVKKMAQKTELPVIASGGISSIEDVKKIKQLEKYGVSGVISGKAIYEGVISVKEACEALQEGD
ncbi:1-(5-phosphoribosyl)-5-[(5-phosphoribosylamino)methylideneamino] imidazole-4-carboxamide isomerase [subsurface metagenome]